MKILQTDDADRQVSLLTWVISNSINKCALMSTVTLCHPPAPWVNGKVKEAVRERNIAQKLLQIHRFNTTLHMQVTEIKRRVKNLITSTKKRNDHQELQHCRNNTAATWKISRCAIPGRTHGTATPRLRDTRRRVEDFNKLSAIVDLRTFESLRNN